MERDCYGAERSSSRLHQTGSGDCSHWKTGSLGILGLQPLQIHPFSFTSIQEPPRSPGDMTLTKTSSLILQMKINVSKTGCYMLNIDDNKFKTGCWISFLILSDIDDKWKVQNQVLNFFSHSPDEKYTLEQSWYIIQLLNPHPWWELLSLLLLPVLRHLLADLLCSVEYAQGWLVADKALLVLWMMLEIKKKKVKIC